MASRTPKRPVAQRLRIVSVSERGVSLVFAGVRIGYSSTSAATSATPRLTKEIGSFLHSYSLASEYARSQGMV